MEQSLPKFDREPTELDLWKAELKGIVADEFQGIENPKFSYPSRVPGDNPIEIVGIEEAVEKGAAHTLPMRQAMTEEQYTSYLRTVYRGLYNAHPDNLR